jgi:lipopolysaccharide O-acetyltransferase
VPLNRYHASQFRQPVGLIGRLRAQAARLLRPGGFASLSESALLARPLRVANAHCISIGARTIIGRDTLLQPITTYLDQSFSPRLVIGDDCYVGPNCQFHCVDKIELTSGCVLSDQVYVSDVSHGLLPGQGLLMDQPVNSKGAVIVGANCFIGFGAVLMPGVILGEHVVVGARSIVTRSVPAFTMVAGNPARPIATFDHRAGQWVSSRRRAGGDT